MQVQRLQRHATYGHFKQMVLQIIADDVIDNGHDPDKVFATLRSAPGPPRQPELVLPLLQQAGILDLGVPACTGTPLLHRHAEAGPATWCGMHSSAGI